MNIGSAALIRAARSFHRPGCKNIRRWDRLCLAPWIAGIQCLRGWQASIPFWHECATTLDMSYGISWLNAYTGYAVATKPCMTTTGSGTIR